MLEYQLTRANCGMAVGQPLAVDAAAAVLAAGGNAVDAAVTAALVSAVVAPGGNGIGGYGGHMVVAIRQGSRVEGRGSRLGDGSSEPSPLAPRPSPLDPRPPTPFTVTAIDFNSTAPRAARGDTFAGQWAGDEEEDWMGKGGPNVHGPLAVGAPGTLAGLQMALDRYGTRTFREAVGPAIRLCTEGFPATAALAAISQKPGTSLPRFPDTMALLRPDGKALHEGETFRNRDLGRMLETLAERGRVDSFYDGDIGRQIAAYVQAHGGLLTAEDMAAFHARELAPLEFTWRGLRLCTAPLTAGGLTVLQALRTLAALEWDRRDAQALESQQMVVEAARAAWHDRLRLLGDAEHVDVPVARLLSSEYAEATAERIRAAMKAGKRIEAQTDGRPAGGTVHMSFADAQGNVVALTQTHGGGFGSHVTVGGLGLTLGHGMSRFTPQPGHPNSPWPGKHPLTNMCPSLVLRDGVPVLTVGSAGGRKIVNAMLHTLLHFAGRGATIGEALATPRLHTEGGDAVWVDPYVPDAVREHLTRLGYAVKPGPVAVAHGIQIDPASGEMTGLTEPRNAERGKWGVAGVD
jgi:gamma-glutamyltranspeptidase/glutathione hydrolase